MCVCVCVCVSRLVYCYLGISDQCYCYQQLWTNGPNTGPIHTEQELNASMRCDFTFSHMEYSCVCRRNGAETGDTSGLKDHISITRFYKQLSISVLLGIQSVVRF